MDLEVQGNSGHDDDTQPHPGPFDSWLARATRGLPKSYSRRICAELTDHFEEMIQEYRQTGMSDPEAEQAAIESLGAAEATIEAFNHVHPQRWHLFVALIISQTFIALLFLKFLSDPILSAHNLAGPFSFILICIQPPCLIYMLNILKRTAKQSYLIDQPINWITIALIAWLALFFINGLLDNITVPFIEDTFRFLFVSFLLLVFGGFVWLGFSLLQLKLPTLAGSRSWLSILIWLDSGILGALCLLAINAYVFSGSAISATWLKNATDGIGVCSIVIYSLTCFGFTWLFLRAMQDWPDMLEG